MGNVFTTPEQSYNPNNQVITSDVQASIERLFLNHRSTNNLSPISASYLPPLNVDMDSPQSLYQAGGAPMVVKSRRQRYLKYDVSNFKMEQAGGNHVSATSDNFNELSQLSEFRRIRDYLAQDTDAVVPQAGGADDDSSSSSEDIFYMDDSENEGLDMGMDMDMGFDMRNAFGDEDEYNEMANHVTPEYGVESSSFEARASNIDLVPFYSSDSMTDFSFQHPYVKNRFD